MSPTFLLPNRQSGSKRRVELDLGVTAMGKPSQGRNIGIGASLDTRQSERSRPASSIASADSVHAPVTPHQIDVLQRLNAAMLGISFP